MSPRVRINRQSLQDGTPLGCSRQSKMLLVSFRKQSRMGLSVTASDRNEGISPWLGQIAFSSPAASIGGGCDACSGNKIHVRVDRFPPNRRCMMSCPESCTRVIWPPNPVITDRRAGSREWCVEHHHGGKVCPLLGHPALPLGEANAPQGLQLKIANMCQLA